MLGLVLPLTLRLYLLITLLEVTAAVLVYLDQQVLDDGTITLKVYKICDFRSCVCMYM